MNQTSRFLKDRIIEMLGPAFYASIASDSDNAPLDDPVSMTVSYGSYADCDTRPRLIFWDPATKQWHDASHTCEDTMDEYHYDQDNCTLTVKVCSTTTEDEESDVSITKRDKSTDMFAGPNLFIPAVVSEDFVNNPPVMTSLTSFVMQEDSGTLSYALTAYDPDGDDVWFSLDPNTLDETWGNVTLHPDGQFTYRPCLDCFGTDTADIIVEELRNDPVQPIAIHDTVTFYVAPVNDNPDIFFAVDGFNIVNDDLYSVIVTVEERNQHNAAYVDFMAQIGGYDVDIYDNLTLVYDDDYPKHGVIDRDDQLQEFTFIPLNCHASQSENAGLSASLESNGTPLIPFPCDLHTPHDIDRLAWVVSRVRYLPDEKFFGEDALQIYVIDQEGSVSRVLRVNIYVLENRCVNNGTCVGPEDDLDCTSERRSNGFDGYGCVCQHGFEGLYCELEVNECESNPCPSNYTCFNQADGYLCQCENQDWPCGFIEEIPSHGWVIILLLVLVTLSVTIPILIAFYFYKRKNGGKKTGATFKWSFLSFSRRSNAVHPMESTHDTHTDPTVEDIVQQSSVKHVTDNPRQVTRPVSSSSGMTVIEDLGTEDDMSTDDGRPTSSAGRFITVSPLPTADELMGDTPDEALPAIPLQEQPMGSLVSLSRPTSRIAWGASDGRENSLEESNV
ncbi:uncharacterized protein [Ptychodera flava]|uniref:uncharacterized protein n=1 Tax=Ptychodera flava TaxID=63121 RepID=UPI00396A1028